MKTNLKRLKLAKLLQMISDMVTDKGVITYEGELAVGTEVFVNDENGDMVPASDGEYETDEVIVVIANGLVTEIRTKEAPVVEEAPVEEVVENLEDEPVVEEVTEEEVQEIVEEVVENVENDTDTLNARIAELEATIADLEAKLAEYKEREEKVEEPIEVVEKKQQKMSKVEERRSNAYRFLPRK